MRRAFVLVLVALALALPAGAQFWEKKESSQWSKSECEKMLRDSPWARSKSLSRATIRTLQEGSDVAGRDSNLVVTYTALLWSARPVREAVVRQAQLDPNYARLSAAEKKTLDERHQRLLNTDFSQVVVVRLSYGSNAQEYDLDLARHWQQQSPAQLQQAVYLLIGKRRVNASEVRIAQGAGRDIYLVFPRVVEGQSILGPADSRLALELEHPNVGLQQAGGPGGDLQGPIPAQRVFLELEVKKMQLKETLVF